MAKKPAGKPSDDATATGKVPVLMTILQAAGFGGAAIGLTVLVAAMHDLGFVDLTYTLHAMIVPMLVLIILSVALYAFAGAKIAAARLAAATSALERLREEFAGKVAATEARIEAYLGPAHAALVADNEGLKKALEDIRRKEDEKLAAEIKALREKNAELQEKISAWAVDAVGAALSDEMDTAA